MAVIKLPRYIGLDKRHPFASNMDIMDMDLTACRCNLLGQFFLVLRFVYVRRHKRSSYIFDLKSNHSRRVGGLPHYSVAIPAADQALVRKLIAITSFKSGNGPALPEYNLHELENDKIVMRQYIINYFRDINNDIWIWDATLNSPGNPGRPCFTALNFYARCKRPSLSNAAFICVSGVNKFNCLYTKVAFREPRQMNDRGTAFESMPAELL